MKSGEKRMRQKRAMAERAVLPRIVCVLFASIALLIMTWCVCVWNYRYCRNRAESYSRIASHLAIFMIRENSEEIYDLYSEDLIYYRRMQCKYANAAWQPWLTLLPDPPEPKMLGAKRGR